jgi:hypothetical protein
MITMHGPMNVKTKNVCVLHLQSEALLGVLHAVKENNAYDKHVLCVCHLNSVDV